MKEEETGTISFRVNKKAYDVFTNLSDVDRIQLKIAVLTFLQIKAKDYVTREYIEEEIRYEREKKKAKEAKEERLARKQNK